MIDEIMRIFDFVLRLKSLERQDWPMFNMRHRESIAAHTFGTAMLAWLLAQGKDVDLGKLLLMALIHDLPEAITGNIAYNTRITCPSIEERIEVLENEALGAVLDGSPALAPLLADCYTDYQLVASREAEIVHDADKLEYTFELIRRVGTVAGSVGWELMERVDQLEWYTETARKIAGRLREELCHLMGW